MIYIKDIEEETLMTPAEFRANVETISTYEYEVIMLINRDTVFEGAQETTALRARFAKNNDGAPLLDVFAIMADDAAICDRWLNDGGIDVFAKLSAWSKNILDAYKSNVTVVTGETPSITVEDDGDYMKFSYELDVKHDLNMWESIERNIENALVHKVIYEWMRLNRYMEDFTIEKERFDTFLEAARSSMMRTSLPYRRVIDPM